MTQRADNVITTPARAGAPRRGRPREHSEIIHFHALITRAQRDKLLDLGGSGWIREQIDLATREEDDGK